MAKNNNSQNKRQNKTQRIAALIAGLLALLMIGSTLLSALASNAAVTQSSVNGLKNQLSDITARKKKAKAELDSLKNQKNSILKEIELIDREIDASIEEIELQEQLITELGILIEEKEIELAESQAEEEAQYEKLKGRVRFTYENGSMSYLSILLSSDDFSNFLSRYEFVSQISKYDKRLLEELIEIKEKIAMQKAELETDRADAIELKATFVANKEALEKRYQERSVQMAKVEEAEASVNSQYAAIAEEEDRLAEEIKNAIAALAVQNNSTYVGGNFQWPLPAGNNVVTSKYGMRTHPITGVYKLHTGIDLRASGGTNIFAANAGTVTTATYNTAYGYYVVVDHGGGVATLYAHMSKMAVKKGDIVTQGQVVGYVGSTGYSTANHLHFEIIKNGNYVDPVKEFPGFKVVYA